MTNLVAKAGVCGRHLEAEAFIADNNCARHLDAKVILDDNSDKATDHLEAEGAGIPPPKAISPSGNTNISATVISSISREEAEEISQKELWKHTFGLRNFEIERLWQRLIYLGAFLLLIFSGYGMLWQMYLTSSDSPRIVKYFDYAGLPLASLLLFFSVLWICMARGSKFWYEYYEKRLDLLENNGLISDAAQRQINVLKINEYLKQAKLQCIKKSNRFSPSKINICIGWIFLMISILAIVFHCIHLCRWHQFLFSIKYWIIIIIVVGLNIICSIFIVGFCRGGDECFFKKIWVSNNEKQEDNGKKDTIDQPVSQPSSNEETETK